MKSLLFALLALFAVNNLFAATQIGSLAVTSATSIAQASSTNSTVISGTGIFIAGNQLFDSGGFSFWNGPGNATFTDPAGRLFLKNGLVILSSTGVYYDSPGGHLAIDGTNIYFLNGNKLTDGTYLNASNGVHLFDGSGNPIFTGTTGISGTSNYTNGLTASGSASVLSTVNSTTIASASSANTVPATGVTGTVNVSATANQLAPGTSSTGVLLVSSTFTGPNITGGSINATMGGSGTWPGGTVGTSSSANSLFGNIVDTAHLAGMNNDWHCTLTATGNGSLIASGAGYAVVGSGTSVILASGTTSFTVASGTTTIGGVAFSSTTLTITSTAGTILADNPINTSGSNVGIIAGTGPASGPTLKTGSGGRIWCTGTDDFATFNSAYTSGSYSVIYVNTDFTVSNTPIVQSNTSLIGLGGHMWHIAPYTNEPGIGTVLTGATISSSNFFIRNLTVDCNKPEQNSPRLEGTGFLQGSGTATAYWTVGSWFGSCTNGEIDGLTIINACTFSRVWSNAYNCVSRRYRNYWTPNTIETTGSFIYVDNNFDGDHIWGPCAHLRFYDGDYMGDDDQMATCPVENSPEDPGGVGVSGTNIVDVRRGHGGPVTDVTWQHNFMRNARNAYRLGGLAGASGTNVMLNVMDQIKFIDTSGTTWIEGNPCLCNLGAAGITFDGWQVASGTGNAGSVILVQDPDQTTQFNNWNSQISLSRIRCDTPVWIVKSGGNNWDTGLANLTGQYIDEIKHLRDGCIAYWTFNTDTSGTTAYDWSGHGLTLSNSNSVAYTTGTGYAQSNWGNAAYFTGGTAGGCLYTSNTNTCPNLATMPEWTVFGWYSVKGTVSTANPGTFVFMDGTNNELGMFLVWNNQPSCDIDFYVGGPSNFHAIGTPYNNTASPSWAGMGAQHWNFFMLRKRASDGYVQAWQPNSGPGLGIQKSAWTNPGSITGVAPQIIIGARQDAGNVSSLNGYMDNIGIWNRCLSDREVWLLWNPGSDGNAYGITPLSTSGWYWGGRWWPFNN